MIHKYFREKTGQWEIVPRQLWEWEVTYEDGTVFKQYDDKGIYHTSSEIDQSRQFVFKMVSQTLKHTYALLFNPKTMELFYRYRRTILRKGAPDEVQHKMWVFGYVMQGKSHFFAITPVGELIITDDLDAIKVV